MRRIADILALALMLLGFCSCGGQDDPVETPKAPAIPENIELHSFTKTSLTFQWDATVGATGYGYKLLEGQTEVKNGTTTTRNVKIEGLKEGTAYRFAVCATNEAGASPYSPYFDASTEKPEEPVVPVGGDYPDPIGSPEQVYASMKIPAPEEDGTARAFPGAEGGGMYTTGGRGGRIIHVTNLGDSGEGSLRAAIGEKGARTIVFDVAGTIALKSTLEIKNGDLTIAGQTAPGDGICIKNYPTVVKCSNIIIRFIRFRLGDEAATDDSFDTIWGRYQDDLILDHCSMSWSIDECASFYANRNFTMQWCTLAESLNKSKHSKGDHGYGGIWGGRDASFHHNLIASHNSRTPRPDHPEIYDEESLRNRRGNVDFRNNVIYNWGSSEGCYGGEGGHFNFVGNYFKPGPASSKNEYFIKAYGLYNSKTDYGYPYLYLSGNVHTGSEKITSDNSLGVVWKHGDQTSKDGRILSSALKIEGREGKAAFVTTHSADKAFSVVCDYAGASLSRDLVDKRSARDAKSGTATCNDGGNGSKGGIIDSQTAVDGWPNYTATQEEVKKTVDTDADGIPDWYEALFGLDMKNNSDGAEFTIDKSGRYSNFEMYLHYLVRDLVAAQIEGGTYGNN